MEEPILVDRVVSGRVPRKEALKDRSFSSGGETGDTDGGAGGALEEDDGVLFL